MSQKSFAHPLSFLLLCSLLAFFSGCKREAADPQQPPVFPSPKVLQPEAPGEETLGNPPLTLDISNLEQGYFVAKAQDDGHRKNIQLVGEDQVPYSYFLAPGEEAVIPITSGSGTYQLSCYQEVEGSRFAALYAQVLEVSLENEFLPFLYPNQYISFTPDSQASKLALSLLPEDATDTEGLEAIYKYVTSHIVYDDEKAASVGAGYLPDVDETLATGKGICFDYAALMTAMLRSRDIPSKLQIGYSGEIKHAWIDVYLISKGWVEAAVYFDGETWQRMDPTFASNSEDEAFIESYIGDGSNYTVQFSR
ncbi:MAG: transglutaminase-like domain-containing protein [Eubacteriales bacterium]|nr:transglutaminase-like domain-containing protein [Eubacteriales bacterium]